MSGHLRQTSCVLHVITGLGTGGAESMLAALAMAEAVAGRAPLVVSLTGGGPYADRLRAAGVPVHHLNMPRGLPSPVGLMALARIIRKTSPAAVQGWMYHANLAAAAALALSRRRAATPLYWGIRCSDMDFRDYSPALRWVVRAGAWTSGMPAAIVCNSEAGMAIHRGLGYRGRLLLIDNGIDTARFRPDPAAREAVRRSLGLAADARVAAHVGRVDPMKDHPTFLAALDRLPGLQALAVGAGTEDLPDRPGLIRLGRREDVPALLAAADVVVSSSAYGEGFSNAVAEGMAAGLPAAATDVGDARRIVGAAGVVVPPRDPAALADAIGQVLARAPAEDPRGRIEAHFSLARAVAAFARLHRGGAAADVGAGRLQAAEGR